MGNERKGGKIKLEQSFFFLLHRGVNNDSFTYLILVIQIVLNIVDRAVKENEGGNVSTIGELLQEKSSRQSSH